MAFSNLRRQTILAAAILLMTGPTAESLVSPSLNQRHRQFPSILPSSTPRHVSTRSSIISQTSLLAVSLDSSKASQTDKDDASGSESKENDGLTVSKFRQLKDVMWIRETLEDWTAAEFALSVEQQAAQSTESKKTKKRAVDYEKLMTQLTKRIEDMTCQSFDDYSPLMDDDGTLTLDCNLGMGRYAYTGDERMDLMEYVLMYCHD